MTKKRNIEDKAPEVVMPNCPVHPILKGQSALVTGASSGIGRGIAIALGKAGANVVVNYIGNGEAAEEVVEEIGKRKGHLIKGGRVDENRTCSMIIRDWQEGRLRL